MVDPFMGVEIGKSQIEMIRNQIENEHFNLATLVADDLELEGYPVEIKEVGTHRVRGIKVKKWIIICKEPNINQEIFQKKKDKITKELAKQRQAVIKEEMKELKRKHKGDKKRNRKR